MERVERDLSSKDSLDIIEDASLTMDLLSCIVGKKIGEGAFRKVFEYSLDPNYVVKIEKEEVESNLVEYLLWCEIGGLINNLEWVKDWFAPIKWISPDGKVLLMQKTYKTDKEKPKKIPKFLYDVKEENFGWIGDKYVCHDYGILYGFINYKKVFVNSGF